jgi:N-acetylglutamate synthase-like GNAT family acetyltransferase
MKAKANPIPARSQADAIKAVEDGETVLRDGHAILIRPIRSQDRAIERKFIESLSPRSRRFRFLGEMNSPSNSLLEQLVEIDASKDVALIALILEGTQEKEIGVARLSVGKDGRTCEFAVTVSDEWQRRGLGTLLMQRLIDSAKSHGIQSMYSMDAADNGPMQEFAKHLGFSRRPDPNDATQVLHSLDLGAKV